jgi:hypothetical protein
MATVTLFKLPYTCLFAVLQKLVRSIYVSANGYVDREKAVIRLLVSYANFFQWAPALVKTAPTSLHVLRQQETVR